MRRLSELASQYEQMVLNLQLPCGGWGYTRQWTMEPTCMAVLALRFRAKGDRVRGLRFLEGCQNADGSWPCFEGDDEGSWATALAVITLIRAGGDWESVKRGCQWLLGTRGQSLPQLMSVGRGFKEDVSSTPNTTLCMRTRDETSAQYFIKASSQRNVPRRTLGVQRRKLLSWEHYSETGMGAVTEMKEARALDEHIKNLPKAQMEVLMSDDTRGTLHGLLHVVPPPAVGFPDSEPGLSRRLLSSCESSQGACLRFKDAMLARSVKLPPQLRRVLT
jgi:hypothetical protein